MRHLPFITIVFWVSIIALSFLSPDLFLQTIVKFSLVIILSILLSASFWFLQSKGLKLYVLAMPGILLVNAIVLIYGLNLTYSTNAALTEYIGGQLSPEWTKLIASTKNQSEKNFTQKLIFGKQINNLPLTDNEEQLGKTKPPQENRSALMNSLKRKLHLLVISREISYQVFELFFMLALHVTIFITLLIYFILYDKPEQPVRRER